MQEGGGFFMDPNESKIFQKGAEKLRMLKKDTNPHTNAL